MVSLNEDLVIATQIWTGYGNSNFPYRKDQDVINAFGHEVLQDIKSLEEKYYLSEAYRKASDLEIMGKMATEDFKKIFPGIDPRITEAFEWCYTFDYK